jgi:hypothetical protein
MAAASRPHSKGRGAILEIPDPITVTGGAYIVFYVCAPNFLRRETLYGLSVGGVQAIPPQAGRQKVLN